METLQQQKTPQKTSYGSRSSVSNAAIAYPSRTIVHAKLEMTQPCDHDEQEADAAANDIVSGGKIRRKISNGGGSGTAVSPQVESQIAQLQGGGHAMPAGLRNIMENGFGRDFSQVCLHTDSQAADMSSSISARAFTHGNDIYFNRGQFSPNTAEGQRLVAHELTHVAQGTGKVGRKIIIHNGVGKDDQRYLENLLKILENHKMDCLKKGERTGAKFLIKEIKNLEGQLSVDKSTTNDIDKITKKFKSFETKTGNLHFIFAHGAPDFLRYNGKSISAKNFSEILPFDAIKPEDTIVLISCQTGLRFAQDLSKTLPNNIIVAPTDDLFRDSDRFTVGNKGSIYFFLNGREIMPSLSFSSFFSGSKDNFSPRHDIVKIFSLLQTTLNTIPTIDIEKATSQW